MSSIISKIKSVLQRKPALSLALLVDDGRMHEAYV